MDKDIYGDIPISEDRLRETLSQLAQRLLANRSMPVSTYRLQFNHEFTFKDAKAILPYLRDLGISDCYASPYFMAKRGSLHGYDILDHHRLNSEIGTDEEYAEFTEELRKYGLGQILDIVPNHMCISGNENAWWVDVLENGPSSIYADFFDIDWKPVKAALQDKVLFPILGEQYGRILENQELSLLFEDGAFFVRYSGLKLPVNPSSYIPILKHRVDNLEKELGKDHPQFQELLSILTALNHLPPITERDPEKMMERQRKKEIIKKRLTALHHESEAIRSFISDTTRAFNGVKGDSGSFDLFDQLLAEQVYRLSHWRVATDEINYRRFFDINELAAIRAENIRVLRETHRLMIKWVKEKKVTGLRVDHPDGLYNPVEYFYRLQKACFVQICLQEASLPEGTDIEVRIGDWYDEQLSKNPSSPLHFFFYVAGEKILTKGERIPEDWPIFGTTGYDFLNSANGLFVDARSARAFDRAYTRFIRERIDYQDLVCEKKKLIMRTAMASEINTLGHYLDRISEKNRHTRDFTLNDLTTALIEVIAQFPVYRTYANQCGVNERDRRYVEQAVARARRKNPSLSSTVFDFLESVLLLRYPDDIGGNDRGEWLDFVMRFQQLTGPVMAKGLEDTTFYIYNRLISLNEVGGSPERFGTTLEAFHGNNIEKAKAWPYGLNATSTHDTKRSEDFRARLNVLSEIPERWTRSIFHWSRINRRKKAAVDGRMAPDRNEEYHLYQTLMGVWPNLPMDAAAFETFKERIKHYMLKAIREAKVNTSWISPNAPYEEALLKFIDSVVSPAESNAFMKEFAPFQKEISYFGMFNSLSQTLLKIASPGVPDFYQGTEVWDFHLVDPDNRRPVDYSVRKDLLEELKKKMADATSELQAFHRDLVAKWQGGSVKLYVIFKGLNYRAQHHQLFREGDYLPLPVEGNLKNHVCAFARQRGGKTLLVLVPRFLTHLIQGDDVLPLGRAVWGDTEASLPEEVAGDTFLNIFTEVATKAIRREGKRALLLNEVFSDFPVAMLESITG